MSHFLVRYSWLKFINFKATYHNGNLLKNNRQFKVNYYLFPKLFYIGKPLGYHADLDEVLASNCKGRTLSQTH